MSPRFILLLLGSVLAAPLATAQFGLDLSKVTKAIQTGTEDLAKNKEKIAAADPLYQWIDLAEARTEGIMPIPYSAAK